MGQGPSCDEITDLRERCERLEAELVRRRELDGEFLRQVIDINPHLVFAKDRGGRFTLVNKALAEVYGTTVDDLIGRTDADFNPISGEVEHFRLDDVEVIESRREKLIQEEKITDAHGRHRWLQTIKRPIVGSDGRVDQVLGVSTDITRHKELEERLSYAALHDALTELPNRALFRDRLQQALANSQRTGESPFALLYLDLDRFKRINDSLGHHCGDELLRAVARVLERVLNKRDTAARLGGDEFTILVQEVRQPIDAIRVAERLRQALSRPLSIGGREIFVSASVGIVLSQGGYQEADDMLRDADTAMYRAKAVVPGEHVLFDPEMQREVASKLELENDLRRGCEDGELELFYQPVIRVCDGAVAGYEALIRWRHPQRGLLLPEHFLGTAEEAGLTFDLDEWAVDTACRWILGRGHRRPAPVSVNLFSRQLMRNDLPEFMGRILRRHDLGGEVLRLEVTENALLNRGEAAMRVFRSLRDQGVRIDLDDFGTGYSSLSYLQNLPLDRIKIDRSFVNPWTVGKNRTIVRTVIALAHNLGLEVVAEGVETRAQLDALTEMGCDFVQGNLLAPPRSATDDLIS
jgi:diguanylate cyclase (GGDEF)-like protein/PAS domain S-box-containing protein